MTHTPAELAELEQLRSTMKTLAADRMDRELGRYRTPAAMRWRPEDYHQSALELMAMASGAPRPDDPHPLTAQRLASRASWSTTDLVRDILAARLGDGVLSWDDRQVLAGGVGTPVLGDLYGETANRRILSRMPRLLEKVSAFTAPIEVRDFRPMTTGVFELEVGIDTATDSIARNWQTIVPRVTTNALGLFSAPIRLRFTEQFITDDAPGALNSIIDAVSMAAAQNELASAFGVLNTNGNLSDGAPLFGAGNTVAAATRNAAGIDAGIAKLRGQELNGAACDAEPYSLLVPAADEGTARALAAGMSLDRDWLRLVASSYLTAGSWILAADPSLYPTVLRGTLAGGGGQSLSLSPGNPNQREGMRDVILEGGHTFRYQALSRVGLVKISFA